MGTRDTRCHQILDAAPEALVVLDRQGLISIVNQAAERMFGYTREELMGSPIELLVPERLRAAHAEARDRYTQSPKARSMGANLQLFARRHDGLEIPVEIALTPLEDDDGPFVAATIVDITERFRTSLANEWLAAIVGSSDDAIIGRTLDGRITSWNPAAERIFGYSAAEVIGQPVRLLYPPGREEEEHAIFERLERGERVEAFETERRHKDGHVIHVSATISPIRDASGRIVGASKIACDITERKRAQAAAALADARLREAVEAVEDAFVIMDPSGRIVMHNNAYRAFFSAEDEPLVGREFMDVVRMVAPRMTFSSEEERQRLIAAAMRFDEPRQVLDVQLDGRSYRATRHHLPSGGAVGVLVDRTDDIAREEELRKASNAKSEFLASMSHELRTPLNAILGFAQLLQRDRRTPLNDRQRAMVDQVLKGGEHLLKLIDEVLDLARIEAGRVDISPEPVSVTSVLDHVKTTLGPLAARADVALAIEPLPEGLPAVLADRVRFGQVLINFGSNAVKYGKRGGHVVFSVSRPSRDVVRVTVTDDGIGIAEEKQAKIFQPFHRAGQETGPIEGTGIGLVITKRLATLMGGSVGFTSELGKGSSFWIDLPAAMEGSTTARTIAPSAVESPLSKPGGRRYTVLYIEDNPANIAFMEALVGELDRIQLITAPTAEIGIALAIERRPDVIILDINLPGMNGIEARNELGRRRETAALPVIALSAAAMKEDMKRADEAGFYRYLKKPVRVDELLAALEELLLPAN